MKQYCPNCKNFRAKHIKNVGLMTGCNAYQSMWGDKQDNYCQFYKHSAWREWLRRAHGTKVHES